MKHIYITNCTENGGIYHYTFVNGNMTFCDKLALDRPMYTKIYGNKFYSIIRDTETGDNFGGFLSGEIDKDGKMTVTSKTVSTKGIVLCRFEVVDNDIYVVNYLSGNIVKLPDNVITHTGKGTNPQRQEAPHTHYVTVTPDKNYVLCTDLGLDKIFVYDRDLNEVFNVAVPSGSGCRHLIFSDNGKYLYCVNELTSDVSVFFYNDGKLTLLNTYDAIPDYKEKSTAAAIRINRNYLYTSHRGADCITTYRIVGDRLELISNTYCGGKNPRDFDIIDDYIICTNEGGSISILKINGEKLELQNSFELSGDPLCVSFYIEKEGQL